MTVFEGRRLQSVMGPPHPAAPSKSPRKYYFGAHGMPLSTEQQEQFTKGCELLQIGAAAEAADVFSKLLEAT
jgi:hypothetical protein